MAISRERRVLFGGAALALAAGLGVAAIMMFGARGRSAPPPASQGGLMVQTAPGDDTKLDPKRPLRCFVNGQFVGEMPLDQCAGRNGVATGALDVGLDPNGALAASSSASAGDHRRCRRPRRAPRPDSGTGAADPSLAGGPATGLRDAARSVGAMLALPHRRLAGLAQPDEPGNLCPGSVPGPMRASGRGGVRTMGRADFAACSRGSSDFARQPPLQHACRPGSVVHAADPRLG